MARTVSVQFLGNTADLEAALERAGIVAEDTSKKIQGSAAAAGRAAAEQARVAGASATEQEAAAAKAAAGYTEMAAKITAAQRSAGNAAVAAARSVGASVDEQRAAYTKAIATQGEFEAAQKRAADAAAVAADKQAAAARKVAAESEASAKRQSAAAGKLAATVGKWTLGAGLGAGYFSVKGATDFQSQMERLHTQAGASQQQVGQLSQGVLGIAPSVATGPNELAQAMYHVTSSLNKTLPAVSRNATELKVLKLAAEGAKVGGADLVDVTNALDAAVVSGIPGTKNYQQAMGALNATVGAGDMQMQDLADALSTGLLGPMKTYGLNIKEIGGALAVFGDNNIRGQQAATKLASAVRIMAAPSKEAAKALGVVGLSATTLADDMRRGGLVQAITDLKTHLEQSGLTASQQAVVITRAFGGRQSTGVQLLVAQLDRLRAKTQQVGEGAASFGQDWAATQKTFKFELDQLGASVEVVAVKFGTWLIPKLEDTIHVTEDVVGWFGKHRAAADALAVVVGGVLTTAVSVYAFQKATAFISATKGMVSGVTSLAGRVLGLGGDAEAAGSETTQLTTAIENLSAQIQGLTPEVDAAAGSVAGLGGDAASAATEVEALGGAAASATPEVAGLDGAVGALGGTLGALGGKLGVLSAAFAAFEALKQTPGIGNVLGNGPGPKNAFVTPKHGETERNYLSQVAGLPAGYKGPLTAAGVMKAREGQGYPADRSLVERLFRQINEQGHFGHHGFVPKPGGARFAGAGDVNPSQMVAGNTHSAAWAESLLAQVHAPESKANINSLVTWIQREGNLPNVDKFNPLDTTMSGYGGHPTNSVGVQSYPTWASGVQATAATLSSYPAIMQALMAGKGLGVGGATAKELLTWSGGGYSGVGSTIQAVSKSPSASTQAAYNALVGATSAGGKATMRYVNHRPVGLMTEAQWQAYQAAHPTSLRATMRYVNHKPVGMMDESQWQAYESAHPKALSTGSITTTLTNTLSRYRGLEKSAPTDMVGDLYKGFVEQVRDLAPKFEEEAKNAKSATGLTAIREALSQTLTHLEAGLAANVKLTGRSQAAGPGMMKTYQSAAQSGTVRTLGNALGVNTTRTAFTEFQPQHGVGREFAPAFSDLLRGEIESLGRNVSTGGIGRALGGTLARSTGGSVANSKYVTEVHDLIATGQRREADQLVAAHKAAMNALAVEMYAQQVTKDGKELDMQATALKDQTAAIQNMTQDTQTAWNAVEQKINDMAAATVQHMQDVQQATDDMAASVVTAMKDLAQIGSDQSKSVVDAINDQTQTQVDQIGEKGLYGLNLVAQQEKVTADKVQGMWDQTLDKDQQAIDVAQYQADQAEALAKINLDNLTTNEHMLVATAQQNLDQVTIVQESRISRAQAHADAVQLHVDTSLIGPAQIAVDMNANSSKAVQDKMAAQLAKATGLGDRQVGAADRTLAAVQQSGQGLIDAAQKQYDATNNQATKVVQGAQDTLSNVTNYWDKIIQGLKDTLTKDQGAAQVAEAGATGAVSVTQAKASTEFKGSGLVVNMYGMDLSNAGNVAQEMSWAVRSSGLQVA